MMQSSGEQFCAPREHGADTPKNAPALALLCTFAAVSFTIAAPVTAKAFSANQVNLTATLNAIGPGDTVVLKAGGYGVVSVPRKSWQTPINIDTRLA